MRYAKLINSQPVYAQNPILHNGFYIGNPPDFVYEAEGYKPVRFTDAPETDIGYEAVEGWTETEIEIIQTWEIVESEVDPANAMEILFGGEPDET
jgi:hypothetical protein